MSSSNYDAGIILNFEVSLALRCSPSPCRQVAIIQYSSHVLSRISEEMLRGIFMAAHYCSTFAEANIKHMDCERILSFAPAVCFDKRQETL